MPTEPWAPEDQALLERLARRVVERRLAALIERRDALEALTRLIEEGADARERAARAGKST